MGGGWVDTYDIRYIDRYAEQLWLTVFAKSREMTLFNYINLLQEATPGERPWQAQSTNLQWSKIVARANGKPSFASVAGESLDLTKPFIDKLGTPIGIASYRPYQAIGEDFLHNFFGMIGIPINLLPTYPKDADVVLLTEAAKSDPAIVSEMKASLTAGKTVVITSGLLHALEGKGIEDLVELRYSSLPQPITSFIGAFGPGAGSDLGNAEKPVLFPQVRFFTNDAWPVIRGVADQNAFPILLMDKYAAGTLFVLVVPDNFADLYQLPEPTLNALRSYTMGNFPVRIEAPAKVSLFAYDNGSFIVESFRDEPTEVTLLTTSEHNHLQNLQTGDSLTGEAWNSGPGHRSGKAGAGGDRIEFRVTLQPHSFLVFQQSK